jgi:hypothetical protein
MNWSGSGHSLHQKTRAQEQNDGCVAHRRSTCAAAHKLAQLIYSMITKGQEYTDQRQDYFEQRYQERVIRTLSQRAKQFGMRLAPVQHESINPA